MNDLTKYIAAIEAHMLTNVRSFLAARSSAEKHGGRKEAAELATIRAALIDMQEKGDRHNAKAGE
jgi:hypothetical protein